MAEEQAAAVTEEAVRRVLKQVNDPELGLNVVDLGLVYGIEIDGGRVHIRMTLTTPACPIGPLLSEQIQRKLQEQVPGVEEVEVQFVWEPMWTPDMMSEELKEARRMGLL